jgi:hypothetical protein
MKNEASVHNRRTETDTELVWKRWKRTTIFEVVLSAAGRCTDSNIRAPLTKWSISQYYFNIPLLIRWHGTPRTTCFYVCSAISTARGGRSTWFSCKPRGPVDNSPRLLFPNFDIPHQPPCHPNTSELPWYTILAISRLHRALCWGKAFIIT